MKKFIVITFCAICAFLNTNAQNEGRMTWSAGFNLAPQSVYQFGNEKPAMGMGFFGTTTLSTSNAGISVFYGAGNNSYGIFIFRNVTPKASLYSVAFKDFNDRGKYLGVGTMYGLGAVGDWFNASAFFELGAPFGMQNNNPMICAGVFIGVGKTLKKF